MSLHVSAVHRDDPRRWDTVTVSTPADVDDLVAMLSRPDIGVAHVEHGSRLRVADAETGDLESDHVVYLGALAGFGYFEYVIPGCRPAVGAVQGDPAAPQWNAGGYVFHAGAGVPLDLFRDLVLDFLATGLPSDRARWTDQEVHPATSEDEVAPGPVPGG